jgi:hypothetical protein
MDPTESSSVTVPAHDIVSFARYDVARTVVRVAAPSRAAP